MFDGIYTFNSEQISSPQQLNLEQLLHDFDINTTVYNPESGSRHLHNIEKPLYIIQSQTLDQDDILKSHSFYTVRPDSLIG